MDECEALPLNLSHCSIDVVEYEQIARVEGVVEADMRLRNVRRNYAICAQSCIPPDVTCIQRSVGSLHRLKVNVLTNSVCEKDVLNI